MKTLAIVPARGGSKRLKNKNIKFFFGKPILQRTFNIIKKSGLFDKIILTTDSPTIRNIGKKIGFELILNRSKKLSNSIDKDFDIPKDSIASIRSEGLFGKKSLLINPGFDMPFDSSNKNITFTETTDSYSIDMFLRYLRNLNE